ncbi:MAG TPA: hypothetical protein VJV79_30940 [Polyangiaceae bacterium]|nr:hypothetical protein [Polyangiaceae bacterium]
MVTERVALGLAFGVADVHPITPAVQSPQPGLVLDAGALQALESRPIRLLVDLQRDSRAWAADPHPGRGLAQSWRGGLRSAALAGC